MFIGCQLYETCAECPFVGDCNELWQLLKILRGLEYEKRNQ